ncbi:acyltransferase family protein [Oceaniovalibus guishaninsula JLT2003]|uniref:Glycerol-3-phosphate acyltransferase n=1 Tax=Oceaniovalibus guishaninsula JLT2003 TaxID=1231392 RepID=K2I9D0_9RHOB|nr:1-acyl-sn-glycerol-3-phosphate acyltransferase [Oceaniovalibus guishaninsula]EKE45580.1 acyltransferase family protein [Oceaniovalibus guishaninsula JLT2003]
MFGTIEIPVWLFILILLFAAVTAGSHLLFPSVRWFFRRRMEHAVGRLNLRLERPIQPFKLARRHDTIQRLIYDPAIAQAVADHARATGIREDVAFAQARKYAREIVPAFSASAYFGFAIRFARWLSTQLYDVRLSAAPGVDLALIPRDATIVFVMNHRSNMDYVLVTYLAADRSALTYAVGEWARIWPLSALVRAMGAYFIRRRSRDDLYRKVLARYVQMATAAGVTQAIFPEGGLSLTGASSLARLGLLSYIAEADTAARDVVFVPIGLNYDRVIEDRVLIDARLNGDRRFRGSLRTGAGFAMRWSRRRLTGRLRQFGIAAVAFGHPLSLREFKADRLLSLTALGRELSRRIDATIPVLPVPLAAAALLEGAGTLEEVETDIRHRLAGLVQDRPVHLLDESIETTAAQALDMLVMRRIVQRDDAGKLAVSDDKAELLAFYAMSLGDAAPQERAGGPALVTT